MVAILQTIFQIHFHEWNETIFILIPISPKPVNFDIPGFICQVKNIKFGPNIRLDMLLKKPALQLIRNTHDNP